MLETDLTSYLRAAKDYSSWRVSHLAGPLRVAEFREVWLSVVKERVGRRGGRSATKWGRGGRGTSRSARGLPMLSWEVEVMMPAGF